MNEESLILYYYQDGLTAAESRAIAAALETDPDLARRYRRLARELDALGQPAEVPMPEGLEYRLHSLLERASRGEAAGRFPRARSFHYWSFTLGAGFAAALALGLGLGLWMSAGEDLGEQHGPGIAAQPAAASPVEWSQAAFLRGLESHLRSARVGLADLQAARGGNRAELAASLLQRNRAYQELAIHNDAPQFARVLRSFESRLVQLAREDLTEQQALDLQAQLEFEFSVVLTKLARAASQQTGPNTQELKL